MWPLINAVQFFTFMTYWKITYPKSLGFILFELKRISMGEFIDGLEIGDWVGGLFGIDPSADEAADDKIGANGIGDKDFLENFGPTFILFSTLFAILIAIVLVIIYLQKRCILSEKNRIRYARLKNKVFWNPVIRYLFLNALKLNFSAMIAF